MIRRRARPLLGTLVEIRGQAESVACFEAASEAAFAAIAQVHGLMSFHEASSDLRRIARARTGEHVRVHPSTATVLRRALRWSRASRGAFDPACAQQAVAAGRLPAPDADPPPTRSPAFEQAVRVAGSDVHVCSPVWLDLGGIAKGYAVDRAVTVLRRCGVTGGTVNAGGDLRVFGAAEETIHVRSPFDPGWLWPVAALRDAACATSAGDSVFGRAGDRPSAAGEAGAAPRSITVIAPTACAADALTKIVALRGHEAAGLLRRARAHAFVVQADGRCWRL